MLLNSYHQIPTRLFFMRQMGITLGLTLLAFLWVGPLSKLGFAPPRARGTTLEFYRDLARERQLTPDVCKFHLQENEVQREVCQEFQSELTECYLLAFFPVGVALIYLWIAFIALRNFYRKPLGQIETGKALERGVLTDPPHLPRSFFDWYFCLQSVSIQRKDGRQYRVYLPLGVVPPRAGQTLDIFYIGTIWGEKRRLGLLSIPHVAVVRGR